MRFSVCRSVVLAFAASFVVGACLCCLRYYGVVCGVCGVLLYDGGGVGPWWSKYSDGSNFESAAELHSQQTNAQQDAHTAAIKSSAARSVGVAGVAVQQQQQPQQQQQQQQAPNQSTQQANTQ